MATPATIDLSFAEEAGLTHFDATACMGCGVCIATCPMGIDVLPRKLFRYAVLGLKDEILANTEAIFQCLLCKLCEEICTSNVPIVENILCLRSYINREVYGIERGDGATPATSAKEGPHAAAHA